MPEHARYRRGAQSADGVSVAAADGGKANPDQHVTRAERRHRDVLDPLGWTIATSPEQLLDPAVTIDALACADEVPLGRPAPYLVHRSMERTGVVDVRRVLVGGDTVRDLESGMNAGAGTVIGVLTGKLGASGLGRVRHHHLLDSVADLPDLLDL